MTRAPRAILRRVAVYIAAGALFLAPAAAWAGHCGAQPPRPDDVGVGFGGYYLYVDADPPNAVVVKYGFTYPNGEVRRGHVGAGTAPQQPSACVHV